MSGQHAKHGSAASLSVAVLTAAALMIGAAILSVAGGASGADLAVAGPDRLRSVRGLLLTAELLKFGTALAMLIAIVSIHRHLLGSTARRGIATATALVGIAALVASGILGLVGVTALDAPSTPPAVQLVPLAGSIFSASLGLWIMIVCTAAGVQPVILRWLRVTGLILGLTALCAAILPPLSLLVGLLSVPWWAGLSRTLGRAPDAPALA